MLFYGYRYYSPELGRWVSRDPLGEHAFFTHYVEGKSLPVKRRLREQSRRPLYPFVGNSPLMFSDALGLACVTLTGCTQEQIDKMRKIPEDWKPGDPPLEPPTNGTDCDFDGFWIEGNTQWLGVPNHCDMTVQCNADGSITFSCKCDKLKTGACICYNKLAPKLGKKKEKCNCGFYPDSGDYEHPTNYPF